jgi:hypothetical protein
MDMSFKSNRVSGKLKLARSNSPSGIQGRTSRRYPTGKLAFDATHEIAARQMSDLWLKIGSRQRRFDYEGQDSSAAVSCSRDVQDGATSRQPG